MITLVIKDSGKSGHTESGKVTKRSDELIGAATSYRKWYMDRLDWIEVQLPIIASEYLGSDHVSESFPTCDLRT